MDALAGVLLVLGLMGFGMLPRYMRSRDKLRLREMAHRERVLALEKGILPADLPESPVTDAWVDEPWTTRALDAGWDRRIALAIGLVMLFGGIGLIAAFYLVSFMPFAGQEARQAASLSPLGIIPVMAGFGLLLYYLLTSRTPRGSREVQVNGTR